MNKYIIFKNELDKTKNELDKTKNELDKTTNELDTIKNLLDKTKNELNTTKNELDTTKNELDTTKNEFDKIKYKLSILENTCSYIDHEKIIQIDHNKKNLNKIINNPTLSNLVYDWRTDKNTTHSYLELYEKLLKSKKISAKNILEIGIWTGGSIKLWNDYFINATIYGVDIIDIENVWNDIKNNDKIILYTSTNGYNDDFVNNTFINKDVKFDIILDDGPHTLESMKLCIKLYSNLLTDNGILIIEDVQSIEWIDILHNEVNDDLKKYIDFYDLRENKGRYDDIVFVINKNKFTMNQ